MASSKWQRRHYETVARGLKAKNASADEIDQWIRKFSADNPRFRADYFRAAATGGKVAVLGQRRQTGERLVIGTRTYREKSRPRRPFKVPSLSGFRSKSGRCKFGKKRSHGRWVCRKSRRK